MRYSLVRERDGAGDSGPMCQVIDGESWKPIEGETRPRVGCAVRVGSYRASTYGSDYWTTTVVSEILEETETSMRFKTGNSVYKWSVF